MASCATPAVERKGAAVGFEPNGAEVKVLPERRPRRHAARHPLESAPTSAPSDSPGAGSFDPQPAESSVRRPRRAVVRPVHRVLLAAIAALGIIGSGVVGTATAHEPAGLDRFLWALGQVELGGRYDAQNATSGAYGKYQIMLSNWPSWARRYLGDPHAKPTPHNQEIVARGRVIDLFQSLGDWAAVANWWLTGEALPAAKWSAGAVHYVQAVMDLFGGASLGATNPGTMTGAASTAAARQAETALTFEEASAAIDYSGRWASAAYPAYSAGHVRYAGVAGARASLTFLGRSITWYGPVGPTRGRARIVFDGKPVKVVDLRRSAFAPSVPLFARSWKLIGRHSLTIEVLDAPAPGLVAIDRFVVGR